MSPPGWPEARVGAVPTAAAPRCRTGRRKWGCLPEGHGPFAPQVSLLFHRRLMGRGGHTTPGKATLGRPGAGGLRPWGLLGTSCSPVGGRRTGRSAPVESCPGLGGLGVFLSLPSLASTVRCFHAHLCVICQHHHGNRSTGQSRGCVILTSLVSALLVPSCHHLE